ncbi:MAG: hypothetical protein HY040_24175 [Planctomycetes bacterium]|nr:hypothetical protein [Planctomycetota bacterium]
MRQHILALSIILLAAGSLHAQDEFEKIPKFTAKVTGVTVGFRSFDPTAVTGQFKLALWAPVYIDVWAGQKGIKKKAAPFLEVESFDTEGIGTIYRIPVDEMEKLDRRTYIAYTKPGSALGSSEVKVSLHYDGEVIPGPEHRGSPAMPFLNNHLILSLGSKLPNLKEAFGLLNPRAQNAEFDPFGVGARMAAFEFDVKRLPDLWFGYQGVDLIFLSTDNNRFLSELANDKTNRLGALAQWVRRGGRLVIPVAYENQAFLEKVLTSAAWTPPVPVVPPANPGDVEADAVNTVRAVEAWVGPGRPFRSEKPIVLAKLAPKNVPNGVWEPLLTEGGRPIAVRMPYGLGSITLLAFSLDTGPFARWEGRADFLKTLIVKVGSRVNPDVQEQMIRRGDMSTPDITTDLQKTLEAVDVDVVPFGYVALFIILYIIIVGPVDYFVLKYVFKKLEWTWITFPTVVIAVSVAAYFTAYALKGNDMKVNKVDIIDFDLRTDLDAGFKTRKAYAYGHSYIMLFSPRIQNYTVGLEPSPSFWGSKPEERPLCADMVTWMGRPELDGPGGLRQSGSQGFFRRPYSYAEDATGLIGVPIPVWTTRSFTAAWEAALPQIPFESKLVFHTKEVGGKELKITGTLKNNLSVDLEDVYLFYGDRAYQIAKQWPGAAAKAKPLEVSISAQEPGDLSNFLNPRSGESPRKFGTRAGKGTYNPTSLIKQAMFFEVTEKGNSSRNHALRFLDLSWRIKPEARFNDESGSEVLREAILYARVPFQWGASETVNNSGVAPTSLWLGAIPGQMDRNGNFIPQPEMSGTMGQDTYVRILLPVVRAAE